MTRNIVLNSTDSLPIPPRVSSRAQDHTSSPSSNPGTAGPTGKFSPSSSEIIKNTYLNSNRNSNQNDSDNDNRSDSSHVSPSPSPALSTESRRSSRKPVPAYLPMPPSVPILAGSVTDLPSDHPFSAARIGGRTNGDRDSVRSGNSGSDGTPGWREDKDLFFASGAAGQSPAGFGTSLPPPPRKSNLRRSPAPSSLTDGGSPAASLSNVSTTQGSPSRVLPGLDERRGTFSGGLNINVPGMNPEASASRITTDTTTTDGYETARTNTASRDSTPTPTATRDRTPETQYYDRPLPPLPHAPSSATLDMSDMLAGGPPSDSAHSRSTSAASDASPATPRLSQAPSTTPANAGEVSSQSAEKGFSALGGKKFGWKKKSKTEKGEDDEEDESQFSVSRVPSKRALWEAGTHFLRDEDGGLVYFGDLFPKWDQDSSIPPPSHTKAEVASLRSSKSRPKPDMSSTSDKSNINIDPSRPPPRTVVFFIRFFWCGQCQDYMFASICQLDPEALAKANIRVVVISNGSWKFIKAYRKLTKCPFPVYVDANRNIYDLLGMIKSALNWGPWFNGRAAYNRSNVPGQLVQSVKNLPKMPVTSNPGSINQMGGEFILEPGYECSFAHRMTNYSNHMEAADLCRLAGCSAPTKSETQQEQLVEAEQAELARLATEMDQWRSTRESELDRIRRKKAERRGQTYKPMTNTSRLALNLDQTPAFGPTGNDRRGSAVSNLSIATAAPGQPALSPVFDVSVDDANGNMEEIEVLVAEAEEEADALTGKRMSDGQLEEEFEKAMKIEEEAKGRYAARSTSVS